MELLIEKPVGKQLFEIIIGTYEEFVAGYVLCYDAKQKTYKFYQNFTNHAHTKSVKSIGLSCNGILVSGGNDDQCHLIDLRRRKELGNLIEQEGAITVIEFYKSKHLFTASEDHTICVWNTRTWECVKKFTGHKSCVNSVAVHPSGKLMFSVGGDKTVRTWNLIEGRCAFVTNLKESANLVHWFPDGKQFLLVYSKRIDIYENGNCGIVHTIEQVEGINCVVFLNNELIAYGTDTDKIVIYSIAKGYEVANFRAHERRIKSMAVISKQVFDDMDSDVEYLFCSVSSDGYIKLWAIQKDTFKTNLIADIQTKCRPNCMTVFESSSKTDLL